MPFDHKVFDIITNRHGDFNISELHRVLKKEGLFLTQQVGAENDRELVELLQPENKELPFPNQYLSIREKEFINHGFEILESSEAFMPIRFFDVGALVWFAKIIPWEFINFSVDKYFNHLLKAQEMIDKNGWIEGRIHRFYLVARKK